MGRLTSKDLDDGLSDSSGNGPIRLTSGALADLEKTRKPLLGGGVGDNSGGRATDANDNISSSGSTSHSSISGSTAPVVDIEAGGKGANMDDSDNSEDSAIGAGASKRSSEADSLERNESDRSDDDEREPKDADMTDSETRGALAVAPPPPRASAGEPPPDPSLPVPDLMGRRFAPARDRGYGTSSVDGSALYRAYLEGRLDPRAADPHNLDPLPVQMIRQLSIVEDRRDGGEAKGGGGSGIRVESGDDAAAPPPPLPDRPFPDGPSRSETDDSFKHRIDATFAGRPTAPPSMISRSRMCTEDSLLAGTGAGGGMSRIPSDILQMALPVPSKGGNRLKSSEMVLQILKDAEASGGRRRSSHPVVGETRPGPTPSDIQQEILAEVNALSSSPAVQIPSRPAYAPIRSNTGDSFKNAIGEMLAEAKTKTKTGGGVVAKGTGRFDSTPRPSMPMPSRPLYDLVRYNTGDSFKTAIDEILVEAEGAANGTGGNDALSPLMPMPIRPEYASGRFSTTESLKAAIGDSIAESDFGRPIPDADDATGTASALVLLASSGGGSASPSLEPLGGGVGAWKMSSRTAKKRKCDARVEERGLSAAEGVKVGVVFTSNDVLFGRGGLSNHHVGNKRYREEADRLKPSYDRLSKKQKTDMRDKLVNIVKDYGGRFLKYEEKEGMGQWVEVPLNVARKKASQALREGRPPGGGGKVDGVVDQKIKAEIQSVRVEGSGSVQTKVGLMGCALKPIPPQTGSMFVSKA